MINRETYLNTVLKAIRNVGRLIVKENDPSRLIRKSCEELSGTMGYFNAWIALLDQDSRNVILTGSAGFNGGFKTMRNILDQGVFPSCMRRSLETKKLVVIDDPATQCTDCPLSNHYKGRSALTHRLGNFGILSVSVPAHFAHNAEEQDLFVEVANDLAFALSKIEAEKQIHIKNQIIQTIPHPMSLVSTSYRYLAVNQAYSQFFGQTPDRITGRQITDFIDPEVFEQDIKPHFDRCLKGEALQYETIVDFSETGERWMRMEYIPFRDKNNQIVGVVSHGLDITERRHAEEALQKSEERFFLAMEASKDGVWDWDLITGEIYCSPGVTSMLGYDSTAVLENMDAWQDLIHPEDRQNALQANLDCVNNLTDSFEVEYRMRTNDGGFKWVLGRGKAIYRDASGNALRLVGTHQDITERKQTEQALRESEQRLALATESAGIGIWDWDIITDEMIWDKRIFHLYGIDKIPEYYGLEYWQNCLHPDDRDSTVEACQAAVRGEKEYDVEFRIQWPDGTIRWMKGDGVVLRDDGGTPIRMLGTNYDITEQRQAEKALRESEDFLNRTGDMAQVGGWELDLNTMKVFWTGTTVRIHELPDGCSPDLDEAISYYHPEDQDHVRQCIQRAIESFEPFDFTVRLITAKGRERWVRSLGQPIINSDKCVRLSGTFQDITERLQLEEELRQSHKMEAVGTLAGGVAHEFNNMLGIIIGNTELALDDIPEWNPAADCIQEIKTASLRAKDVVRKLLSVARKTPESRRPIRFSKVIKESLGLMRRTIPATIDIRKNITCSTEMILGDITEINQVMINLCTNSVHAMAEQNGVLEVRLDTQQMNRESALFYEDLVPGDYVRLTVKDTGKGIEPAFMDRLFDPYFTTKDIDQGLGMGLAVVHGIVKKHDGAIKIESEVGKGTIVEVLFPLIEAQTEAETEETETLKMGTERILLVDDEPSLVKMITQMLKRSGYEVIGKTSSTSALKTFKETPEQFDLVISDITMPEMSGDQLAQAIKQVRPETPVILCTGHSNRMDENKAKSMGIEAFITKPFQKQDIANTVQNVLDETKI